MGYVESELLRITQADASTGNKGRSRVLKSVVNLALSKRTSQHSAST